MCNALDHPAIEAAPCICVITEINFERLQTMCNTLDHPAFEAATCICVITEIKHEKTALSYITNKRDYYPYGAFPVMPVIDSMVTYIAQYPLPLSLLFQR